MMQPGMRYSWNLVSSSLQIFIRDNAGELKSQAMQDYIESIGAKDYFSVTYKPW